MNDDISTIKITHKNKVLFPKSDITKNDLISYYSAIAAYILPYLKNRALTLQRFPKGIAAEGFFQKNAPHYFPDWVPTTKVKKVDGWVHHVVCNSKEILLYLVNQYAITFHIGLSSIHKIEYPDRLVFDLDPPKDNFKLAVKAAKTLHHLLEDKLELKTYVMTTGSKGLHVTVPLKNDCHFDIVHDFAKNVATHICNKNVREFTSAVRKNKREEKLYIDFLRNSYSQTSVAPFSVRALENAPVATPIKWSELNDEKLHSQLFNITNIFERLEKVGNSWKDFEINSKSIIPAKEKLAQMVSIDY